MKAAELFVNCLEKEGVEHIFGIPGEENLDLLEALSKSPIELILTRHEQAAGFMAATYGRLTGKPGVCLSTLGPGATNLMTAAAYANLGAMPMVVITGQKPIGSNQQGLFQMINVVEMMKPLTKLSRQVNSVNDIPSYLRESFRLALEERPGACHLELPEDIAQQEVKLSPINKSHSHYPVVKKESLLKAVEIIKNAKSPLVLLGAGANRSEACSAIREFIDNFKIHFISTQMGKGVVSENNAYYIGNASLSENDFVHRAFDQADVIINIGHDVVEKPPFIMKANNQVVIHVNFSCARVDSTYFPQVEVIGDISTSINLLTQELGSTDFSTADFFKKIKFSIDEHYQKYEVEKSFPIKLPSLVSHIRKLMPRDGIIALDNGLYKVWFARNYPAYEPNTVLLDNTLATMGAGLSSGIVAAMLNKDKKVVVVCGDGGFMMNSAELETAVRLGINLVILILNDEGLGMIKWKQKHMQLNKYGLDLKNPNFAKYAESYGATGNRIESIDDINHTIKNAFEIGGVHLVELPIDYSDDERILYEELKELSASI